MKIFHYVLIATLVLFGYSCKKDTVGVSKVTTYVTIDLKQGSVVTFPKGSFTDPGFTAKEGSTDVTSTVTTSGTVNSDQVGMYTISYSAVNSDGFSSSVDRTVIIYDPTAPATDLSGAYKAAVARVSPARSYSGFNVSISKVAPGFFHISDFLGGFYDQGFKYGPDYAMTGYLQLNADNTVSLISSHVNGWGDSLNDLTNGLYDPATSTLSWDAFYSPSNYDFKVTLVKQ